jgi:hypothetical protein
MQMVLLGRTVCHQISIENDTIDGGGKVPFTLTKQWLLDNMSDFSFMDSDLLPIVIQPGEKVYLRFCFTPTRVGPDTAIQHWSTDIPEPYTRLQKDFSMLSGRGVTPGLIWIPESQKFASENASIERLWLKNNGSASIIVDSIEIVGPSASEFTIIGGSEMPPNQPFFLAPNDSTWYAIEFSPDTSNKSDRFDTLIAIDNDGIHPMAFLNGEIGLLSVARNPEPDALLIVVPNPAVSDEVSIVLPPEFADGCDLQIFDALGREVQRTETRQKHVLLSIAELPNGTYYLRISRDSLTQSAVFKILH